MGNLTQGLSTFYEIENRKSKIENAIPSLQDAFFAGETAQKLP